MSTAYATTAEALAITGQVVTDSQLLYASSIIDSYVGQNYLNNLATSEVQSGNGTTEMRLNHFPIIDVTKVEEDTGTFDTPSWNEWVSPTNNYKTPAEHGEADNFIITDGAFTKGIGNFRINYNWGYTSVPDEVKFVCVNIAALLANNPDYVVKESLGSYSIENGGRDLQKQMDKYLSMLGNPVIIGSV